MIPRPHVRVYDSTGGSSGRAMSVGLAALMALLKGRRRLRRRRRFLVRLSALARSPLRCDISVPFQDAVTTKLNWRPGSQGGASNRTWIESWTVTSKLLRLHSVYVLCTCPGGRRIAER